MTAHKQTTDGGASGGYTTGYTYNLAGALIEETYPSGRVVKDVFDQSGDLAIVQSKKNASSGYWHYADAFTYNAAGSSPHAAWQRPLGNDDFQQSPPANRSHLISHGTTTNDLDFRQRRAMPITTGMF